MAQHTEDLMAGVISDLKAHARILHRQIGQRDPHAVARSRQLPEFKDQDVSSLAAHPDGLPSVQSDDGHWLSGRRRPEVR